jgi:dihydrofolate reductase
MRNIRYSVAASLDGYIAGPKGEADWIVMDPDIDFRELFARFDALIMGRKTWEAMGAHGGGGGMPGMKTFVFSNTLRALKSKKATLVSGDRAKETLQSLKEEGGKDIWLWGGGELFRSLLEMRLVDAVEVAVIPVLLGGGTPLLPSPAERAKLVLANHRVYPKSGTVWLEYRVS